MQDWKDVKKTLLSISAALVDFHSDPKGKAHAVIKIINDIMLTPRYQKTTGEKLDPVPFSHYSMMKGTIVAKHKL